MAGNDNNLNKYNSKSSTLLGHVIAMICITMWGISFISTKVLLDNGMQPVEIYVYRFALAYIIILAFKHGRMLCDNLRDEVLMALCGILAGSIYFLAENFALQYTLVANVSLLTSTSPLLTAIIVGILYRSERPGAGMIIGSLTAFVGVGCVIFNSSTNMEVNPLGDMLALMAAFSWALYSLVLKRLNAVYDVWTITRKTFFYGVLTAAPFMLVEQSHFPVAEVFTNVPVLVNLLFLGIGASLVAYVMWAMTVKKVGALKANNYMYIQPVITLIFSALILGEAVTVIGCLGCALVLGGLWLGDYLTMRASMKK